MDKKQNTELWKRNVEGNAQIIARRVAESGLIITGVNKEIPEGMEEDLEKCLLDKHYTKILRFEEYPNIRVIIPNMYSEEKEERIRNVLQSINPEMEKEHDISKKIWEEFGITML